MEIAREHALSIGAKTGERKVLKQIQFILHDLQ